MGYTTNLNWLAGFLPINNISINTNKTKNFQIDIKWNNAIPENTLILP